MNGITLITPTGGRPRAFALCKQFVQRQTWTGPLQWIVVDDCLPRTAFPCPILSAESSLLSTLCPTPPWSLGQNTLARNLLAAIPDAAYDKILIVEDDEFYPPEYVAKMAALLDEADIAGCWQSLYFHVPSRQFRVMEHPERSSLAHTGIRRKHLDALAEACTKRPDYIDVDLWQRAKGPRVLLDTPLCIGMKGLAGRPGIGIGHRPEMGGDWKRDQGLSVLRGWIGSDADLYYARS